MRQPIRFLVALLRPQRSPSATKGVSVRDARLVSASAPVLCLALLPALAIKKCEGDVVLVDSSCLEVEATNVSKSGGNVSVGGLVAKKGTTDADGAPCPSLKKVRAVYYQEKNGKPGYQGDGKPPGVPVGHREGSVSAPSSEITIGSFGNSAPGKGVADTWQVDVTDTSGTSTFSGRF